METMIIILLIILIIGGIIGYLLYKSIKNQLLIIAYYAYKEASIQNVIFVPDKKIPYYQVVFKDGTYKNLAVEDLKYLEMID